MADTTLSEREFAKLVGCALATVQLGRQSGRLPTASKQDAKGRWRVDPVIGTVEWEASAPARIAGGDSLAAWREARTRRETALACSAEDTLRVRRGALVEVREIEDRLTGIFSSCRNKLLAIPSQARQRDPGFTIQQLALIDDLIREALEDLAAPAPLA